MTTPENVEADLGWGLFAVLRGYRQATDAALEGVPGGPRGYQVLAASQRGEASSQLALAQLLGVDRTVMTYLLDDLERAGLVERKPDPADRRTRRVTLTDAGNATMCQSHRRLLQVEEELLEPLLPIERDAFRAMLHRVATRTDTSQPTTCTEIEQISEPVVVPPRR